MNPHTLALLKTLKSTGITHYRMAHYYLYYDQPAKQQLANYHAQIRELAALNKEIGIQGLYQNHSGGNANEAMLAPGMGRRHAARWC